MKTLTSFKSEGLDIVGELKIALICLTLGLSAYYLAVYTIGYPCAREPATSLSFYEHMLREAFGEEALYRLLPIMLTIVLFGVNRWMLTLVILTVSVYFALGHNGWPSLLAVAPVGIFLSIAFLYLGGLNRNYLRAYLWVGFTHTFANILIFVFIPVIFF